MRKFNIAGPCNPRRHYMLPPEPRLPEARALVEAQEFFVVHSPRQTGKTTTIAALARDLTATGKFAAIRFSCESAETATDDGVAENRILQDIRTAARDFLPALLQPPEQWPQTEPGTRLREGLADWARVCPLPLVLFFDEVDALTGGPLRNVLTQLRNGCTARDDTPFLYSAALCGMRDVRDYRMAAGRDPGRFNSSSPFNIKVKSLQMADFTREQVAELYAQHTADTGQEFTPEAVDRAFEYTCGQPWLVNAIANEITIEMGVPVSETITAAHVEVARDRLIVARPTHLDSLVARLNEKSVRRIIDPIISGEDLDPDTTEQLGGRRAALAYGEDEAYVRDLGLIKDDDPGAIANPIYREVIIRALGQEARRRVHADPASFLLPDGQLDFRKLLEEFAAWWRRDAEVLVRAQVVHETAPQLVFLAYLTRIVNGGGSVQCESHVGRRRIDVLASKPYTDAHGKRAIQEEAVEIKVWRAGSGDPLPGALSQIDEYLYRLGLDTGTVIIFDRRPASVANAPAPFFATAQTPAGRTVTVLRDYPVRVPRK